MTDPARKYLILRLSSLGDIVHALPAVAALGRTYPRAEIHWIVESRHAGLLEGNPFVHRVIPIDTHAWRKQQFAPATLAAIARQVRDLRRQRYDVAIDFQGLYKSGLIAWLSGASERIGFSEMRLREPATAFFYSQRIPARGVEHVIEWNFALLEPLGVPCPRRSDWEFPLPHHQPDQDYVVKELAASGTRDFLILNPGGGWKSKCWPPGNYADLIRACAREMDVDFLLTGSPAEEPLIRQIVKECGVARARYFPSTVHQFIALARRAKLLVAGDTGPMHLAAAVRTPVVAIFGPTDPARNGPFSPEDITLWNGSRIDYTRRAENAGYLSGISVESVLQAIRQRLERKHA
jgi:heptosyltransferase-1